jgi:hypothetical protein
MYVLTNIKPLGFADIYIYNETTLYKTSIISVGMVNIRKMFKI